MADPPSSATAQAAHVLLDMISAYDEDRTSQQNILATDTAFQRLSEVGAVSGTISDDDVLTLDISPLLTAYGFTVNLLLSTLASTMGIDRDVVIANLREQLDSLE